MATYDFFLSFRGEDRALAQAVHRILTDSKYRVWFYPVDSPTGGQFPDEIDRALRESAKVFVVLTPHYDESPVTRAEFFHGWSQGKLLVLRFAEAALPPLADGVTFQQADCGPEDASFAALVLSTAQARPVQPRQDVKRIDFQLLEQRTTATAFVGRKRELALLDSAFDSDHCAVVCVVAGGGFGKSTLVKGWLDQTDRPIRQRVSAAYSFSFTSQGDQDTSPSSDQFFEKALVHFLGGARPERDPERRRTQLLELLRTRDRALLILDGLEPLQRRADESSPGKINDQGLERFVGALVFDAGRTTTVITSRVMPANLIPHLKSGRVRVVTPQPVVAIELGKLDRRSSIELLRSAGRQGEHAAVLADDATLDEFAAECEDHPLLLSLVGPAVASGKYSLAELRRHRDPGEASESLGFAETVRRLVESQLKHLREKARAVLYAVCLFDDPVTGHELHDRLLSRADIPVFTAPLREGRRVMAEAFAEGVDKLERAAILIPEKRGLDGTPGQDRLDWTYSVHPVIQAGIRVTLAKLHGDAWRQANATLYRALVRSVKKWRPDDKEEMRRLYAAMPHGIRAGWGPRVGWMYGLRCQRGYRAYSTNHLGMIGEDVEAMSHYFRGRWEHIRQDIGMRPFDEGIAYSWAGLVLIGTNQLELGVTQMRKGLKIAEEAGSFVAASRTARHLAFITALLGKRQDSISLARKALALLRRRRPLMKWLLDLPFVTMPHQRMTAHANLGCVLHYFGQHQEAESMFQKAEAIQARARRRYPKLRAIWGYRYADLLLDLGRFQEADDRFLAGLVDPDAPKGWGEGVFAAPLMKLGYLRSQVRQADLFGTREHWDQVLAFNDELRKFGKAEDQDDGEPGWQPAEGSRKKDKKEFKNNRLDILLPAFRAATAGVSRLRGELGDALAQVEAAERAAKDSGTVLFNAEIALERARIHLARRERERALDTLHTAREERLEVSYRRNELERLLDEVRAAAP